MPMEVRAPTSKGASQREKPVGLSGQESLFPGHTRQEVPGRNNAHGSRSYYFQRGKSAGEATWPIRPGVTVPRPHLAVGPGEE
ncbi:hypothetical protein GDO81_028498 [Engystomops pustulosus]|uniref:Uncharacterized protein n=1 Tax=Engystomops pustulosus TaxID=76066 RepID=A0AAV6Z2P2_ENGPU|nr:hypothetical protein GDO81_028498 [Engystomops pustulosus]